MAKPAHESLFRWLGWNTQGDLGGWTFYTSKRKALVWFAKAPPLTPATDLQLRQRNLFRLVASAWQARPPDAQARWRRAAKAAHLGCGGYALFTYWLTTQDSAAIATIERMTGEQLQT
jgi:hypothetical protein